MLIMAKFNYTWVITISGMNQVSLQVIQLANQNGLKRRKK